MVLAGDSAGGGLAAHVAQRLHDDGPIGAALQVLINPGLDFTLERVDRDPALARLLDWETIDWFGAQAFPAGVDREDPTISPARRTDLTGLAPTLVITAGLDPFRADAEHYAERLRAAGVTTTVRRFDGMIHGFTDMDLLFPAARRCVREIARAIDSAAPVTPAAPLPIAPTPIRWNGLDRGLRRRMVENARRLPWVTGPDTAWNLTRFHFNRLATGQINPLGGQR